MRNLKKEAEWKNKKYERIVADIDKEIGTALKEKIKNDDNYKSIADWVTDNAKKYLKNF